MVIVVPEERGAEDAKGEEEAEREAEEERGEDGERDQHRVPAHTHLYKLKKGLSMSLCHLKTEHGPSKSLAYTSNERHSCLKPPSTSWKTPA